MDLESRQRSVDVESLSEEQANILGEQLGQKITKMVDEVVEKANRILNIYGLECKMAIELRKKDSEEAKEVMTQE